MKHLFLALTFLSVTIYSNAQKCLTDYYYEQYQKAHPELVNQFNKFERIQDFTPLQKTNGAVRIIPVVFHIVHEYGDENISKAQVDDAIRILNEDYRKKNPDTSKTRALFKPYATDCEVEFRLAKIDPNGNCTEGIERIYSTLTNDADDKVKAVSDWPSTRYLNVWVVKSIANSGTGTILGYAQFPGGGAATTDGIVVRNDCLGRIGTEPTNGFGEYGRTLTHEIGHWLGLFHTFQGACNINGDQVNDTPPAAAANYGCALTTNSCTTNPPAPYAADAPDMLENYMDYTNGTCQNLFTIGQKSRMDAVFIQYRAIIISAANQAFTGVDGSGPTACAPIADFITTKTLGCTGTNFSFTDFSYNGTITNWNWTFTGASTPNSTSQNPVNISWSIPGVYAVSLTVSNAKGSSTKTRNSYITILPQQAVDMLPVFQGFESTNIATEGWTIENGGSSATWQRNTNGKRSGAASFFINHFSGTASGDIDAFYSKGYNFTNAKKPFISFYTAYAQKAVGVNDVLKMYISIDCGQTWQAKLSKAGSSLAGGVAITATNYIPVAADWRLQQYDLSSYVGMPNIRFRFETTSKEGNNIYIDDINIIDNQTGINSTNTGDVIALKVAPNPFTQKASLEFVLNKSAIVSISIIDMLGHSVLYTEEKNFEPGNISLPVGPAQLETLSGSVYYVIVTIDGASYSKKFIKL